MSLDHLETTNEPLRVCFTEHGMSIWVVHPEEMGCGSWHEDRHQGRFPTRCARGRSTRTTSRVSSAAETHSQSVHQGNVDTACTSIRSGSNQIATTSLMERDEHSKIVAECRPTLTVRPEDDQNLQTVISIFSVQGIR